MILPSGTVREPVPLEAADGAALDAVIYRRESPAARVALVLMHPSVSFHYHYAALPLTQLGFAVACVDSRFAGNDSQLLMDQVALDLRTAVDHLRRSGYERVVLVGNSGGGALSAYYQAEAHPQDAADALIILNAHRGRAEVLTDWLDASVVDEGDPDSHDPSLDMFDSSNGPPYPSQFVAHYRAGQEARNRRITAWCLEQLGSGRDRAFTVHRTTADPRMLDLTLDPSDREIGSYRGPDVRAANYGVYGLARWTSCTSWLSQWALGRSLARSEPSIARIKVPLLFIQGTADQGIYPSDVQRMYDAATVSDKQLHWIEGGTHYFDGQPDHQLRVFDLIRDWLYERGLGPQRGQ